MKKKPIQPQRQLTPDEYIRTKARGLPIYKCYINSYWLETGLTNIIIARQHKNGNFTIGYYSVDTFYKGLFKSGSYFNFTNAQLKELTGFLVKNAEDKYMVVEIDYSLAHNIIYGGQEFAEKKGYPPCKNFEVSKYILEENDDKIEYIEIGFGKSEFREDANDEIFNKGIENILGK